MPSDMARDNDQQGDMDFLRGACHALSALDLPQLKLQDALDAVRYLRAKAHAGSKIPPLMWFLGYVSTGKSPAEVYRKFIAEEQVHA